MCLTGRRGASGQATFEYLFLIFFTIVLLSGFVYQFNGAVRAYFSGYFSAGGYLSCLIEKGILPGEYSDEGTCDPPTFNIQNGQQRQVAAVDFGAQGNANSTGGHGSRGPSTENSGRLNEGAGGTVPGQGPAGAFKQNGKGGGATKKAAETGNNGFSTASGVAGADDSGGSGEGSRGARIPYRDTYSSNPQTKKEVTVPATARDLKTAREIATEKAARKIKPVEAGFNLSFGNIIKWIFLIIILFAIFFFIGSQVVAVSNGNRKRQ